MRRKGKQPGFRRLTAIFSIAAASVLAGFGSGCASTQRPVDHTARISPVVFSVPDIQNNSALELPDTPADLSLEKIDTPDFSMLIPFGRIIATNKVEHYARGQDHLNYHFNLANTDTFSRSFKNTLVSCINSINQSDSLVNLLQKEYWNHDDRILWERSLTDLVSAAVNRIEGLDEYRTEANKENIDVKRIAFLNSLSEDMEENTTHVEFDCEAMSIVEGLLLQKIEQHFLPDQAEFSGYKYCADYYYTCGRRADMGQTDYTAWHAFIVSGATGNIIEAVADPDEKKGPAYVEHIGKDYSFEAFVNGKPLVSETGSVFGLDMELGQAYNSRITARLQALAP